MSAHYDDSTFDYDRYWVGREYEHQSELLAIGELLQNSSLHSAADIGGGYGRLTAFLTPFAKKTILIEPSLKQRKLAQTFLKGFKNVAILPGTTQKTGLPDDSVDLVLVVRVMHHLPEPDSSLEEIYRILKPGGKLILEFANSLNFKSRISSILSGQPILPAPIDRRSNLSIRKHTIAFVNHHPQSVFKVLAKTGFSVDRLLSVSNFRSPLLKRLVPIKYLLKAEKLLQSPLANSYFGPSIFVLAHK